MVYACSKIRSFIRLKLMFCIFLLRNSQVTWVSCLIVQVCACATAVVVVLVLYVNVWVFPCGLYVFLHACIYIPYTTFHVYSVDLRCCHSNDERYESMLWHVNMRQCVCVHQVFYRMNECMNETNLSLYLSHCVSVYIFWL